jgi:hypothetical protein
MKAVEMVIVLRAKTKEPDVKTLVALFDETQYSHLFIIRLLDHVTQRGGEVNLTTLFQTQFSFDPETFSAYSVMRERKDAHISGRGPHNCGEMGE